MKTVDLIPVILTALSNAERLRVLYETARAEGREEIGDDEVAAIRAGDDRASDELQEEIDRQRAERPDVPLEPLRE